MPPEFAKKPYRELSAYFFDQGCVPMGLMRGKTGPMPYVCAKLPNSETMIEPEDSVYFLSDRKWALANLGALFAKAVNGGKLLADAGDPVSVDSLGEMKSFGDIKVESTKVESAEL